MIFALSSRIRASEHRSSTRCHGCIQSCTINVWTTRLFLTLLRVLSMLAGDWLNHRIDKSSKYWFLGSFNYSTYLVPECDYVEFHHLFRPLLFKHRSSRFIDGILSSDASHVFHGWIHIHLWHGGVPISKYPYNTIRLLAWHCPTFLRIFDHSPILYTEPS